MNRVSALNRGITILIVALTIGCSYFAAAGPLSGSWLTDITIRPRQTPLFSAFTSTLKIDFVQRGVSVHSISIFDIYGWLWQEFQLAANFGVFSIDGNILFDPVNVAFVYGQGIMEFSLAGTSIALYTAMTGPTLFGGPRFGMAFVLTGDIGDRIRVTNTTFLGANLDEITFIHPPPRAPIEKRYTTNPLAAAGQITFSGSTFTLTAVPFINSEFISTTAFSISGFRYHRFAFNATQIAGLPLDIEAELKSTLQTTSLTITPALNLWYGCIRLHTALLFSDWQLTGIAIYGVELSGQWDDVELRSILALDEKNFDLIRDPYHGVITLTVLSPTANRRLSIDTYFGAPYPPQLFDWGETNFKICVEVTEDVTFSTSIVIDWRGFTQWQLSITTRW
ncbi:hypothetical protein LM599_06690 [Candidatus Acetothermia bacterium]|nr:hypothetical protein [Candidatus Acetothermia bacterium]MCI2427507.1 hypothetical protein [Candidatus Acetothermia bacterium]MCI2428126.1 hypothetical protein [Candidatus Acetothermia bacterium]